MPIVLAADEKAFVDATSVQTNSSPGKLLVALSKYNQRCN